MCLLMRIFTLIICVVFLQLQSVIAQNCKFSWDNGTEVEGKEDFGITLPWIKDTEKSGKELISLITENVELITNTINSSESKLLFMKPTIEENRFVLQLTEDFEKYEEYETKEVIRITVIFKCTTGSMKMEFYQGVEGTNKHDPEFINVPYIYKLSMPLPINMDLSQLGNKIAARDVDLTNTNISFCLDVSDPIVAGFSVSWSSMDSEDKKLHYATLVTTSVINFVEDVTFVLYATDVGNPPRTSKTSVTIQVDKANSILRFAKPLYIADLTKLDPEEANGMIIPFAGGPVTLESGDSETVTFTVKDEIGDYTNFKAIVADDRSVNIRLEDPPEKLFLESFVLLSLTARKSGTEEKTIFHVSLPGLIQIPGSSLTSESTISSTSSSTLSTESSSSSPSNNTSSSTESSANEPEMCSPNHEDCDCKSENAPYVAALIILGSFFIGSISGIIGLLYGIHKREQMKSSVNEFLNKLRIHTVHDANDKTPEAVNSKKEEFRNSSVSPNDSLDERSVASNDTVKEIKIARF